MLATRRGVSIALFGFVCVLTARDARAQEGGRGFLFHEPRLSLSLRGGWAGARASSDLFAFTAEQLTINRRDFSSFGGDLELGVRVVPRTDVVFSLSLAQANHASEFREFVDNNDLPIEQTTKFVRLPLTVGVKRYLTSTGRTVGRYAWIPTRVSPFVGAGGGAMYYRFHQQGDFIDFETLDVFESQYLSKGWTGTGHVYAGVDWSLGARLALTAQARYTWARATLSRDFSGFGQLDLAGASTTAGLSVRF